MLLTTWEKLNSPSQQMSAAASLEIKRTENCDDYHPCVFLVNALLCLSFTPPNVATRLPGGPASAGLLARLL